MEKTKAQRRNTLGAQDEIPADIALNREFKKSFKEDQSIDLDDLKEDLVDIDDRLNNVDEKMKMLFQKTNYENHKFFKYMSNQIRENAMMAADHKSKLEVLGPFIKLTELHEQKDIVKAMMVEIVPRMQEEAHNVARELIKKEVVSLITRSEHREELDGLKVKLNNTLELAEANLDKINW